jgi:hypothetical protein
MNRDDLVARIKMVEEAISQSLAEHNARCGRLAECKYMLEVMDKQIADDLKKSSND